MTTSYSQYGSKSNKTKDILDSNPSGTVVVAVHDHTA